jgi:hypothetical protein
VGDLVSTIERKLEADLQTTIELVGAGESVTMQFNTWRMKESGNYERTAVKVKMSRWAISRLIDEVRKLHIRDRERLANEQARIVREVARLTQEMQP